MALGQYLSGVPDESSLGDYRDDAEGVLAFLLGLAGLGSSRGSCNSPWGGIGNKSSDCVSWIPLPSYSAI